MTSILIAVVAIWMLIILVSGTLAYRYRSRQMRAAGQEPPSYLVYILGPFATVFATPVTTRVSLPRPLRILLGIVVSAGGLFFLLIAALIIVWGQSRHSQPLVLMAMVGFLVILGAASAYLGVRLLKNDDDAVTRKGHDAA